MAMMKLAQAFFHIRPDFQSSRRWRSAYPRPWPWQNGPRRSASQIQQYAVHSNINKNDADILLFPGGIDRFPSIEGMNSFWRVQSKLHNRIISLLFTVKAWKKGAEIFFFSFNHDAFNICVRLPAPAHHAAESCGTWRPGRCLRCWIGRQVLYRPSLAWQHYFARQKPRHLYVSAAKPTTSNKWPKEHKELTTADKKDKI